MALWPNLTGGQAIGTSAATGTLAGVGTVVKFILRLNWLRLLIWDVVLAVMIPMVYGSQQETFPTQAARDAYAQVANTRPWPR